MRLLAYARFASDRSRNMIVDETNQEARDVVPRREKNFSYVNFFYKYCQKLKRA